MLSYGLLYLDFAEARQNRYSDRVEKRIACFAIIYQGTHHSNYSTEMLHMVACLEKLWKKDVK